PLVSGNLTVGVHVPLAQHQRELFFREVRIYERKRNAVKRQIPSRIPWVFPLVGHGDYVSVVQMSPFVITTVPAFLWRGRIARVAEGERVGWGGGGESLKK